MESALRLLRDLADQMAGWTLEETSTEPGAWRLSLQGPGVELSGYGATDDEAADNLLQALWRVRDELD